LYVAALRQDEHETSVAALNIILSVNVKRMLTDFVKNNFLIILIQLKIQIAENKT
jgi:hypothetical protein